MTLEPITRPPGSAKSVWIPATGGGFWQLAPTPRPADLFSPRAQMAAAARYLRDKYGLSVSGWRPYNGKDYSVAQNEVKVQAPANPYRRPLRAEGDDLFGSLVSGQRVTQVPRRFDTEDGPGMLAADLDRMCRQHFRDGFAAAERACEPRLEAAGERLAEVYDEGYAVGRVERAQGLARDARTRLLDLHFALLTLEAAPKTKRGEHIAKVRTAYEWVDDFFASIAEGDAQALAAVATTERMR